jgi:hypothetical protein
VTPSFPLADTPLGCCDVGYCPGTSFSGFWLQLTIGLRLMGRCHWHCQASFPGLYSLSQSLALPWV